MKILKSNHLSKLVVAILAAASTPIASADYTAAGTDYASLTLQKWTEDSANDLISMVDSFACIIKNTRGDLEPHANGSWRALIDEVACGLAERDNQSGKKYAKVTSTSSRASNTANQEIVSYFKSAQGSRYIANITLREDATALPPFGSWYFSFYNNRFGRDGTPHALDLTKENGFTDIAQDGSDIVIQTAEYSSEWGQVEASAAKIVMVGGDDDTVKFLGSDTEGSTTTAIAGQTNANLYFKATDLNTTTGAVNASVCLDRSTTWQNNYRTKLFYKSDTTVGSTTYAAGSEVELNGGFGFRTSDGTDGFFGNFGIWVDGGSTFTPTTNSMTVTKQSDSSEYTIYWGPGRLSSLSAVTETLSNGDRFRWSNAVGSLNFDNYFVEYEASSQSFNILQSDETDTGVNLTQAHISSDPWKGWMWSDMKMENVQWDGTTGISYNKRTKVQADASSVAETYTKARCLSNYGTCPGGADANMSYATWSTGSGNQTFATGAADFSGDLYFWTGKEPGTGYQAFTIYHDTDGDSALSSGDTPVQFNFSFDWAANEYTAYTDGATAQSWGDGVMQPFANFTFVTDADYQANNSCSTASDCTLYEYNIGGAEWNHGYYLFDSDGTGTALDPELEFSHTYAAADDVNNGVSITVQSADGYNPVRGSCGAANGDGVYTCTNLSPSAIDGKKLFLRYDGESIQGLPGFQVADGDYGAWFQLGNLADGTTLTDSDGTEYVVKTAEAGEMFVDAAAGSCTTAGIDFANISEISMALTDVPDISDETNFPRPSQTWSDKPSTMSTDACDVRHGVATCPE